MMKTLRASVSFPASLHRSLKLKVAGADPRVTLNDYVLRAVATSGDIGDQSVMDACDTLGAPGQVVRSTVKFSRKVASLVDARARALNMSASDFIAAVVAHRLNQHGK